MHFHPHQGALHGRHLRPPEGGPRHRRPAEPRQRRPASSSPHPTARRARRSRCSSSAPSSASSGWSAPSSRGAPATRPPSGSLRVHWSSTLIAALPAFFVDVPAGLKLAGRDLGRRHGARHRADVLLRPPARRRPGLRSRHDRRRHRPARASRSATSSLAAGGQHDLCHRLPVGVRLPVGLPPPRRPQWRSSNPAFDHRRLPLGLRRRHAAHLRGRVRAGRGRTVGALRRRGGPAAHPMRNGWAPRRPATIDG